MTSDLTSTLEVAQIDVYFTLLFSWITY